MIFSLHLKTVLNIAVAAPRIVSVVLYGFIFVYTYARACAFII